MDVYFKAICAALVSGICGVSCGEREVSAVVVSNDKRAAEANMANHAPLCRVNDVPTDISGAICAADADLIRKALFELNAEHRVAVAGAFAKLWMERQDVGSAIPWEGLRNSRARMAYAPFLAQSVRNGRTNFPLDLLREFAREVASVENGTLLEVEAIRVLGFADSANELPFLLEKIEQRPFPSESGKAAILALGFICDARAMKTLEQLGASAADEQKIIVAQAVATRKELARDWCSSQ